MTQLSFIVLDNQFNIVFQLNHYLNIPQHIEITDYITNLTGVTREKCNAGMNTHEALEIFIQWFLKCDRIVAHNIEFDRTIIRTEVMRNYEYLKEQIPYIDIVFSNIYDKISKLDHFDTMIRGNKICNIREPKKDGNGTKLKVPKLIEMYQIFFHQTPQNLHNSVVDTLITMRCYLKLKYHRDVDDDLFNSLVEKAINGENICGHLEEFA
jgi:DNA polymerase-3 subunit alpha